MKLSANIPFRKYFSIIILSFVTAVILTSIFIALPSTENVFKNVAFNIQTKDAQYYKKVYNIELTFDKTASNTESKLNQTKNTISNRLDKYGVEDYTIKEPVHLKRSDDNNKYRTLKVTVVTTKDEADLDSMVASRSNLQIVTPREDVDFNTEENQLVQFLPENYERSEFNRSDFRTLYLKELDTQSGEKSYFAILKPWPNSDSAFKDFLDEYAGKQVGVQTDNFVTPVTVPLAFDKEVPAGTAGQKVFSFNVAASADQAKIVDILYNSGNIPQEIQITKQDKPAYVTNDINYSQVALSVAVGFMIIVAYMYFKNERQFEKVFIFAVSYVSIATLWISALKIFDISVDLSILLLEMLALILIVKQATYRNYNTYRVEIISLILIVLAYLFTGGYLKLFARDMLMLMFISIMMISLLRIYILNMKRFLIR